MQVRKDSIRKDSQLADTRTFHRTADVEQQDNFARGQFGFFDVSLRLQDEREIAVLIPAAVPY